MESFVYLVFRDSLVVISLALAGLVGFSAHRASTCNVKAVAEILTTRRAFMLLSFVKMALWVLLVTLILDYLVPNTGHSGWNVSSVALAGGLVFGMGAAINGACSISTLTGLAAGRLSMLLTLASFCFGVGGHAMLLFHAGLEAPTQVTIQFGQRGPWPVAILFILCLWAAWEAARLWRTRLSAVAFRDIIVADQYRLSTAAFLMGASNGVLFFLYGIWVYTNILKRSVEHAMGLDVTILPVEWALFAFLFAGMVLSARQKRSIKLDRRISPRLGLHILGGFLMGLGAAMIPGGNDVLILNSIPGLSPHAVPAYISMIAGIFIVMLIKQSVGGKIVVVNCGGDICTPS